MDAESLLKKINIKFDPDYFINLNEHGELPGVNSYWLMLKGDGDAVVEGKFFLQDKLDKLIIFEPGFPGGGSTQFEELWLASVLKAGFSVFLIRHGGTSLSGEFSHNYINSSQREALPDKYGFGVIGNKMDCTIADWLIEPYTALTSLAPHFTEVVLCGHSFGPLALISSYLKFAESNPSLVNKITRIVSLSGSIGIIRSYENSIMKVWFEHLNTDWARARVSIGDAKQNTDFFGDAHKLINEQASKILEATSFIAVTPYGNKESSVDEIVHPLESVDFINSLGRGYLVIDKMEYADQKTGRMAHDMESLPAEVLVKLLDTSSVPDKQISVLENGVLK